MKISLMNFMAFDTDCRIAADFYLYIEKTTNENSIPGNP